MKMKISKGIIKKIKAVLEIIKKDEDFKKGVFVISFNDLMEIPYSESEIKEFEYVFKIISVETEGNVKISIGSPSFVDKIWQMREELSPTILVEIKDYARFNEYHKEIKRQFGDEKPPMLFLDNKEGLSVKNNLGKKSVYPIIPTGLRYKIIHFLAQNKDYVQTRELAETFDKKPQEIRKTIGQTRKEIKKFLKIEGNKVIESEKGFGYRIKNIKIKS